MQNSFIRAQRIFLKFEISYTKHFKFFYKLTSNHARTSTKVLRNILEVGDVNRKETLKRLQRNILIEMEKLMNIVRTGVDETNTDEANQQALKKFSTVVDDLFQELVLVEVQHIKTY